MKPIATTLALLLATAAAQAAPVTVNFDGAVDNDITNDFAGLTITKIGSGGTGPVRTWLAADVADPILSVNAHSGSNILGLQNNAAVSAFEGTAIKIVFDTAVSSVRISAKFLQLDSNAFSSSGLPFLAAYAGTLAVAADLLGSDPWNIVGDACLNTTSNICQSGWDTLSFSSATANIRSIVLGGNLPNANDAHYRALFDTLVYDAVPGSGGSGSGGTGGGGTVPEPGSLALCVLGLALATRGRWRKTPAAAG